MKKQNKTKQTDGDTKRGKEGEERKRGGKRQGKEQKRKETGNDGRKEGREKREQECAS